MPRTVEVPARGPLSDLLRKAARVEPLPPSAEFLYGASAQSVFGRLKFSDPRRRRIAPCFAPHDFPRRRVRHALKMLAGVGRGMPLPLRSVLSGAPFPRSLLNRAHTRCIRESRALHAGNRGVRRRTVCVRSMYDQCTVCVRSLYGLCTVLGWAPSTSLAAKASTVASGRRPGTRFWEPHPRSQCRSATGEISRARRLPRGRCGVRICADCGRECTVLAWAPSALACHTVLTRRPITWVTAFLADRLPTRAAQQPGHSAHPRLPVYSPKAQRHWALGACLWVEQQACPMWHCAVPGSARFGIL